MYNKVELCGVNTAELPVLSEQEKRQLLTRARAGDQSARQSMIEGNLRLVLSVVQRFAQRGENLDDLFQVGCIGLIKAIDNFDPAQEVRFSTYGVPMIIGEIRRFLRDNNALRVSRSLRDTAYRAMQSREQLEKKLGREPTVEEIARQAGMSRREVAAALESVVEPISLEEPVYTDGGDAMYVIDQVRDPDGEDSWISGLQFRQTVAGLTPREKKIMDVAALCEVTELLESHPYDLSGGEQQRAALAKVLLTEPKILLLDEPTNHLDIPTREIMEKAIQAFGGTCLIVSHDRYFLDKVVTRTLELDNGRLTEYLGNYTYYKEKKKDLEEFEKDRGNAKIAKTPAKMTVSKAEPKKVEKKGISIAAAKKLEQVEMEIARQEATVKMYTFRMNSEPENYAALTEEYKDAEEKLAKLYERWDAIAEDM